MDTTTRCTLIIDSSLDDQKIVACGSRTVSGPDAIAVAIAGAIEGAGWCRPIETVAEVAAFLEEWSIVDPVDVARDVFGAEVASAMFRFLRAAREVRDGVEKADVERGLRADREPDDDGGDEGAEV